MSEQLLTILKLCLLALLYLFFFRVLRAVWAELRAPVATAVPGGAARSAARPAPAAPAPPKRRSTRNRPTELVTTEPPERRGTVYTIGAELTVGRAGGCAISIPDDTFVSSLHARVYATDSQVLVEDLGSTNGTFLNRTKVTAPVTLTRGDQLKIGNTVLEAR